MLYEKIRLYENRDDVTLTTFVNDHNQDFLKNKRRPAVLICPGGAYLTCSEGEGDPVAMAFNAMGYQAFVLNYSVYMEGKPSIPDCTKKILPNQHCIFPNPMLDIKQAMEEINKRQEEWHVNTKEIVLCGFSAGGHNCGMYSVYWKKYNMPKPAATILGYAVGDYRYQKWHNMNDQSMAMYHMANIAIAGTEELDEEKLKELSIVQNISSDTPPMFLWNTSEDEMVPTIQSIKIAEALSIQKVPFEYHMFEKGPHGLSLANESSSLTYEQVNDDVAVWIQLAHKWLKKRLHVELLDRMPF